MKMRAPDLPEVCLSSHCESPSVQLMLFLCLFGTGLEVVLACAASDAALGFCINLAKVVNTLASVVLPVVGTALAGVLVVGAALVGVVIPAMVNGNVVVLRASVVKDGPSAVSALGVAFVASTGGDVANVLSSEIAGTTIGLTEE